MLHAKAIALVAVTAVFGVSSAAAADSPPAPEGAQVFNFGQCVSEGFPAPSDREFGPLIFIFNPDVFNVPPGLKEGPAENPLGQIACPVVTGP